MVADLVELNMGEVAEWFKAAVLKTVDPQGSGGSNPSLSATSVVLPAVPGVTFSSSINPGPAILGRAFGGAYAR